MKHIVRQWLAIWILSLASTVGQGSAVQTTPAADSVPVTNAASAEGQDARARKNPVASTPESLALGKVIYDGNCAACHGDKAQGAVRAGTVLPMPEKQSTRQPPDLTDDEWDHGSSDGEIFTVIKSGIPLTMMPGFDGGIVDNDIWAVVNYIRSLRPQK